jgi:hypothetical protein
MFFDYLKQPSTLKGLTLLASSAAVMFGYGDIFNVELNNGGLKLGGAIGAAVPVALGVWEVVRNEYNGAKKLMENNKHE